jgi:hypothetical protein
MRRARAIVMVQLWEFVLGLKRAWVERKDGVGEFVERVGKKRRGGLEDDLKGRDAS